MTIKIYPGQQPCKPIEEHPWQGYLSDWFSISGIDYERFDVQPVRVFVDGVFVNPSDWSKTEITNDSDVAIYPTPFGGIGKIFGKVFNLLFGWLMPKGGSTSRNDPGQGRNLSSAEGKANAAKLNQTVPETFGHMIRYPDYLVQPRRYFSGPRTQNLEMFLCIGPGEYDIDSNSVKVGNTLFNTLEGSEFIIHHPNEDLSGIDAAKNWYSSPEIGSTSAGTAGLDLTAAPDTRVNPSGTVYTFSNGTSIASNVNYPDSWSIGTAFSLQVSQTVQVSIITIQVGTEDFITVNAFNGDWVEIRPTAGQVLNATGIPHSSVRVVSTELDANYKGIIRLEYFDGSWKNISTLPAGSRLMSLSVAGRTYSVTSYSPSVVSVTANGVSGWVGFPAASLPASQVAWSVQPGTTYGEISGPFVLCPASEVTRAFEVDFFFPQGLHAIDSSSGDVLSRSVGVSIEYRSAGGGDWQPITRVYTEATLDQIGYTVRVDLPTAIRPEVRVRRRGARSTSSQVADGIQWYGARCLLRTPTSYPWTTMSVRLRGLGKISASSENQINLEVIRRLPTIQTDGTWSAPMATRDISAAVWYICKTIGYGVDGLDTSEILRLHAIWSARGENFDATLDETTVQAAIETAFASGMSGFTLEDGKIRPVRPGIRTIAQHAYSAQNTSREITRQFAAHRPDDKDGVEVEFQDAADGWSTATVKCMLPDSLGLKLEKVKLIGVTDKTRAWRIGMRRAREQRFERWSYSFGTELDALNSTYGDFVSLVGDQSALMTNIQPYGSDALVTVSEPLRWKQGDEHVIAFRRADGSQAGPWIARKGVDECQIVAPIPDFEWPQINLNQEPPHVYFGPVNSWRWPAIIRSVSPSSNDTCTVQAVNYDKRIYDDDDNQPPVE